MMRSLLIVEVAPETARCVRDVFSDAGYVMFDVLDRAKGRLSSPAWNTLAVPEERTGV